MVLNLVIHLTDVLIVEEMEKLDLIKGFLQSNKHVLNVMETEKKSPILVLIVMVKVKNKHQKKYQLQFQKV